ncbi:unnamed protein product [Lepeophtheirus salmonis]|uniref:(salmon louse) hypothetical protein n=1 Tax=Lepeophtheirus salmonis TaxID=72036 RepID=A0A7R8HAA4_LEPSM|nr:unnamed protein product [Lepeophtheirus salmonis]CAF2953789.1 unnamed protein product [Lepeophtheirus salmonis]
MDSIHKLAYPVSRQPQPSFNSFSSFFDETLVPVAMVSRRKILSRSRDDLNLEDGYYLEEEDLWYQKEKIVQDDEIWAKVIVLERNRRVAKAYARAPVLTISGSEDGFDGFRIGVNGFANPMRDPKTEEFKAQIGAGCKIKMDETGNIMVKRFAKSPVFVKNTIEENAVSNDVLKLPDGQLEFEKPVKLFDMKKFQQNVNRELKRTVPDRKKLECQCVAAIAFMLRAKMPPGPSRASSNDTILNSSNDNNNNKNSDPHKRFPASGSSDEDPYSLTPSGSSGSSGKGNRSREELAARIPPGEKEFYGPQNWAKHHIRQIPDYSDDMEDENTLTKKRNPRLKNARHKSTDSERTGRKPIEQSNLDDPYYCGLRARVPAYVQQSVKKDKQSKTNNSNSNNNCLGVRSPVPSRSTPNLQNLAQLPGAHPFWWHSRLYPENELSSYHYPGRMRNQGYRNSMPPPISALAPAHKFRNNWD